MASSLGKIPEPVLGRAKPDPWDVGSALDLLIKSFQWVGAV